MYSSKPDVSESVALSGILALASLWDDVEESKHRNRDNVAWRHPSGLLVWAVVATASTIGLLLFVLVGSGSPFGNNFPEPDLTALGESTAHDLPAGRSSHDGETLAYYDLPSGKVSDEECVTPAYPLDGPDSDWYTLKGVPPPDPCPVRGMVIEKLEPKYNFRRPHALGIDMGNMFYILPYVRAFQDRTMGTRKRRVLIDLGGNEFTSSILWFLRNYPLSFTEIHVFEVQKGMFQVPASKAIPPDLLENMNNHSDVPGAGSLPVPERVLNSIRLYESVLVGTMDREAEGGHAASMNITRFMLDELQLSEDDAVVMKMDIEWAEWDVLRAWLEIPRMSLVLDELFVEVHYNESTMSVFGWNHGPGRDNATALLGQLRKKGFFTHFWP